MYRYTIHMFVVACNSINKKCIIFVVNEYEIILYFPRCIHLCFTVIVKPIMKEISDEK